MNPIIYPLLMAVIGSADTVFEKYFFNKRTGKYKIFVPMLFVFAFIILMIFFVPFIDHSINASAFSTIPLVLFFSMIAIASVRNMMYYYSFQREGLCDLEPFIVFVPLVTIVMAGLVYPDERSHPIVLALAIIASLALVFSHIRKKHLVFDKALFPMFGVIILSAAENLITKELLVNFSPIMLYTIRSFFIALLLLVAIRPKLKEMNKNDFKNLFAISFLWVFTMIFYYYAYQKVGIVYTELINTLTPVLIVMGSYFFLKDRSVTKRNVAALIIIIICVIIAQFIG
jgi:drug/metabolite transporter (DMT)-like permease